jgi:hypothetical protein
MWLRAARHRFLTRALAVALAAIVCGGALDWGHAGGDDPDCNPALVHHDHSAHRSAPAPPQPSQPGDHCYLCHSLRLLHTALSVRGGRVVFSLQSTQFHLGDPLAARSALSNLRSSRAPPAVRL